MRYAVLVYENEADFKERSDPKTMGPYMAAYGAYSAALREAGVAVGGAGLQPPSTATTLRVRDGRRHVQDGPFADTKERIGGFFLLEVPSLDVALEWAAKCPAASRCGVEVRPELPPPPQ